MPDTRYRLTPRRLPARCKSCHAVSTVTIERTVKGDTVLITWCCRLCSHEWPMSEDDCVPDRRTGQPDRDTLPRTERRIR
jgi:hypothetical protein